MQYSDASPKMREQSRKRWEALALVENGIQVIMSYFNWYIGIIEDGNCWNSNSDSSINSRYGDVLDMLEQREGSGSGETAFDWSLNFSLYGVLEEMASESFYTWVAETTKAPVRSFWFQTFTVIPSVSGAGRRHLLVVLWKRVYVIVQLLFCQINSIIKDSVQE
jgi:hypothetical protein